MQALGFGKPGGTTNFYDAQKMQQRGLEGAGGAQNLMKIMDEITTQYGVQGAGGKAPEMQEANIVASQVTGLTLDQVEAIQEVNNTGKSQEEKLKAIEEIQKKTEPLAKQALDASKEGFSGIAKRLAGIEATNIAAGAQVADSVQKVQDMQRKLFVWLTNVLAPYMSKAVNLLEQLVAGFERYDPKFNSGSGDKRREQEKQDKVNALFTNKQIAQAKWAEKAAKNGGKLSREDQMKAGEELGTYNHMIDEALSTPGMGAVRQGNLALMAEASTGSGGAALELLQRAAGTAAGAVGTFTGISKLRRMLTPESSAGVNAAEASQQAIDRHTADVEVALRGIVARGGTVAPVQTYNIAADPDRSKSITDTILENSQKMKLELEAESAAPRKPRNEGHATVLTGKVKLNSDGGVNFYNTLTGGSARSTFRD
jgi:hypothetical protein